VNQTIEFKPKHCNNILERVRYKIYQLQKLLELRNNPYSSIEAVIKLCRDSCYEIFEIQHIRFLLLNETNKNICVECFNKTIQNHLLNLINNIRKLAKIFKLLENLLLMKKTNH
jgi:hypothetical protein